MFQISIYTKNVKLEGNILQYLSLYPNGMYADQACSRIAGLEKNTLNPDVIIKTATTAIGLI